MPMNAADYGPEWQKVSLARREAAGWRCEWCGAKQGDEVVGVKGKPYKIVLTVAHLGETKHVKTDHSNLAALCQPCHLRYDHADHIAHARKTRMSRKAVASLFEVSA